jgi:hypothetical protein
MVTSARKQAADTGVGDLCVRGVDQLFVTCQHGDGVFFHGLPHTPGAVLAPLTYTDREALSAETLNSDYESILEIKKGRSILLFKKFQ